MPRSRNPDGKPCRSWPTWQNAIDQLPVIVVLVMVFLPGLLRRVGHTTFCSANQITKISDGTVVTRAEILHMLPVSCLDSPGILSDPALEHLRQRFALRRSVSEGLDCHRFSTLDRFRNLVANADINSDSFPTTEETCLASIFDTVFGAIFVIFYAANLWNSTIDRANVT